MNKALIILTTLILIPFASLAEDQAEQTAMDKLLDQYELRQQVANAAAAPQNLESENRRLKNEIIDLRVEKDGLREQVEYLQAAISNINSSEDDSTSCRNIECVPLEDVRKEKIVAYMISSLGIYRIAELLDQVAPEENIEAHTKAQEIMNGVKSDLKVLGFDTSDMSRIPELDEILEQIEIAYGSRLVR